MIRTKIKTVNKDNAGATIIRNLKKIQINGVKKGR